MISNFTRQELFEFFEEAVTRLVLINLHLAAHKKNVSTSKLNYTAGQQALTKNISMFRRIFRKLR